MRELTSSFIILVALIASGCASPSLQFPEQPMAAREINGIILHLFRSDNHVQVIRTGVASRERQKTIEREMHEFVRQMTKCDLNEKKTTSDTNVLSGELVCLTF